MLLSTKDMELLKILCWCKNIPYPAGSFENYIYTQKKITEFEFYGFAAVSRDGGNIRPRPAAYRLLKDAGYNYKSDIKAQTRAKVLTRRNTAAQILLTFHRAGISVFNNELPRYIDAPLYIASYAARQKDDGNPFGNNRFYGIFCTPQEAFLVYYVDDAGVFFKNERNLFHNFIEITGIKNTAIIMMGRTTAEIGAEVLTAKPKDRIMGNLTTDSFAEIYETATLPVHFIPTGDAGAQMLKFLLIPDYREAVAKAILKKSYNPPYKGLYDTDTVHYTEPYNPAVVAVDMDVNRIDRAVISAQKAGFEKIAIYALAEQMPFLKARYAAAGTAGVMRIDIDNIKSVLDYNIGLYQPLIAPYFTKEGRCFDVSDFAPYRKNGNQVRP